MKFKGCFLILIVMTTLFKCPAQNSFREDIAAAVGVSSGALVFGGETSKFFKPNNLLSLHGEVGYKNWFLSAMGSVAWSRSKNYIRDEFPWNTKGTYFMSWPRVSVGRDLFESERWRLRPNLGFAVLKIEKFEDSVKQRISEFSLVIGLAIDFRLKKLNSRPNKSQSMAIRLEPVVMPCKLDNRFTGAIIGIHLGMLFY
ncbi:MAG: hypothetical protein ACKVOK_01230 [Flavobacteriales bacterium]